MGLTDIQGAESAGRWFVMAETALAGFKITFLGGAAVT